MHLFYEPIIKSTIFDLNETESKHAVQVLRLVNGKHINVTDGKGTIHNTVIKNANPKKCRVRIVNTEKEVGKRIHYLHMAVAPTKNTDRFEWFLEKATEIGIDEITPVLCEHSERRTINFRRCEKVIISAMKQSYRAYFPKLNKPTAIKDILFSEFYGKKFIAHCFNDQVVKLLKHESLGNPANLILIGPEGDFSEREIMEAVQNKFVPISLGKTRLRTETAALVACHTVNLLNDAN